MVTKAELVRAYCEISQRPVADTEHRAERLRKAGMLPTTGRGPYAAQLDPHHVAVCFIAFLAIHEPAINAPEIVETYGNLLLDPVTYVMDAQTGTHECPIGEGSIATFVDTLTLYLRGSQARRNNREIAIQRITLTRTGNIVRAAITLRHLKRQDSIEIWSFSTQSEPELPLEADGEVCLPIQQQCAIDGQIIDVLADLLSKAENETSLSVDADRPAPLDDKPRGANPEAIDELFKSSVCVNKVQPRSESRGRSSGGSSLLQTSELSFPSTEISDDDHLDQRPDPVAAPAA
jgi:hypothetical protein